MRIHLTGSLAGLAVALMLAGCERGTEPTAPHTTAPETNAPAVDINRDRPTPDRREDGIAAPAGVVDEEIESPYAEDPEGESAAMPETAQPEPTVP